MAKAWTDVFNSLEEGQFTNLTEKAMPLAADLLVLESAANGGAKRRVPAAGFAKTPDAAGEGSVNVTNVVGLTQAEYDASAKDANTLYLVIV